MNQNELSHVRGDGSSHMVDVSDKNVTKREATARAVLHTRPDVIAKIADGSLPKGEALPVARVAAIMAAKRTHDLIPLCHPLPISAVTVDFISGDSSVSVTATVRTTSRTGVEMEALTAASVGALTVYDMIKAVDKHARIDGIQVLAKSGGKSGDWQVTPDAEPARPAVESTAAEHPVRANATTERRGEKRAAVLIASTRAARGEYADLTGPELVAWLREQGYETPEPTVVADGPEVGKAARELLATGIDVLISSGGTGISPSDATPQQLAPLIETPLPGIAEKIRAVGQEKTPYSLLTRAVAGLNGNTLLVALPGSPGGVRDGIAVLTPILEHVHHQLRGRNHE
ncbi:bifunctional molybdenum cofactor biosynthesis protein MoaC/MoaB [Dermabacteraceae bacterium TAE3-ERU5]|nr:bifunctional molybdenum cofactor biosynthesis protein MoaC/MoaB [Dermabacteraceae bacterium TAE3-ERU5]